MTITKPSGGVQQTERLMTGTQAVAQAVRLADVDVMAAYPIRPYDGVMQAVAKLIANGELDAEYIVAEGEHSQFEICKHASAVGSRVFVGSSGVGWMYAMESLAVTPPLRLPVVAMIGNRALDDPGAFGVEHNDAMCVRDLGWQLVWVEDAQECFDATLMAYRVGEDKRVSFPVGLGVDGAFITHSQALVKIPDQESVDAFLPPYDLGDRLLHPDNPISIAPQANEDWVMEIRRQNWEAAKRARGVIKDAYKEFNDIFGDRYAAPYYFDEFMTDDAETVLIGVGTVASPARTAVRRLREKGQKVGYVNLRWFRPFPTVELRESLSRFKAVGVVDRDFAHGSPDNCGILMHEVRSCLYPAKNRPAIVNFMGGLGGRDLSIADAQKMFEITQQAAKKDSLDEYVTWIGLRE
jgi:pyruvate ferredoxin oxidoreductase alpha subunit